MSSRLAAAAVNSRGTQYQRSRRTTCPVRSPEAIAAIVVLSVAIPGMFWALRDAQIRRADPALDTRARWLATEKLESIIADRHSASRGYSYVINANYPSEASVAGFAGFSRSTSVSETAADLASAGTGYKRVTVTVSYTGGNAQSRTLSLSTILTDY